MKAELFKVLKELHKSNQLHFARDLSALMRRMFPTEARAIAEIMNPARFGRKADSSEIAKENEAKTWVFPGAPEQAPASAITAPAKPVPPAVKNDPANIQEVYTAPVVEKKSRVVAEEVLVPSPDGPLPFRIDALLKKSPAEIVDIFGSLKDLKQYLSGVMEGKVSRNASAETAVEEFKNKLKQYNG